jgi:hypothetical protein
MSNAQLVLEYVRVLLSWPVIVLALSIFFLHRFHGPISALIGRIGSIKLPGGGELLLLQTINNELVAAHATVGARTDVTVGLTGVEARGEVGNVGPAGTSDSEHRVRTERERAHLWEYRYLNYFLVPRTQLVLDWLATRPPTSYATYDAWMLPYVQNPLERQAMVDALRNHHLIAVDSDMISVTEKGREYILWRGPVQRFMAGMFGAPPGPPPLQASPAEPKSKDGPAAEATS